MQRNLYHLRSRNFLFVFYTCLLFFTSACETNVEVDIPEHDAQMVMNALITPDDRLVVKLSESQYILSQNYQKTTIDDAEIRIFKNRRFEEVLTDKGNGLYKSELILRAGNNYIIEASAPDFVDVRAVSYIPDIVKISRFDYKKKTSILPVHYNCSLTFNDPMDKKNYYFLRISTKHKADNVQRQLYIDTKDKMVAEDEFVGESIVFTDEQLNGMEKTLQFEFALNNNKEQLITVEFVNITFDLYLYLKTRAKQIYSIENPFIEPVEVHSNIINGLGIFAGFTPSVFTFNAQNI